MHGHPNVKYYYVNFMTVMNFVVGSCDKQAVRSL